MNKITTYVPKAFVTDRLRHYGFGAVLEVTSHWQNGIPEKVAQAKRAADYLNSISDIPTPISAGLSLVFNNGNPIYSPGLNFGISIGSMHDGLLEGTIEMYLRSGQVGMGRKRLLERVCSQSDVSLQDILLGNNPRAEIMKAVEYRQRCAAAIGMKASEFNEKFDLLAGDLFEYFTSLLFHRNIEDKEILVQKTFKHRERDFVRVCEMDVLVICPILDFAHAIDKIGRYKDILATSFCPREQ